MANNIGRYILTADVKLATDVGSLTTTQIEAKIDKWMQYFDSKTRNWFNERDVTANIEGNNTSILHFNVPILSITSIKLNGSSDIFDVSNYEVFNNNSQPDDRKNPRIKLYSGAVPTIFQRINTGIFLRGTRSEIIGKFGFLEPDGTTPLMVQDAIMLLVVNEIKNPIDSQIQTGLGGINQQVRREKTDGHEKEFFENKRLSGVSSTGFRQVDEAIRMYKAPGTIRGSIMDNPVHTLTGYNYKNVT